MNTNHKRGSFSGSVGFVLAAAGSAVGLGNIWRFPYLAAKDGGGVFLLCYLVLALTFGFTLLTTEIAIGRKTGQSPLTAYGRLHEKWKWIGILACLVPFIILPYYCTIGGWVLKYLFTYLTGNGAAAVSDAYFSSFISGETEPIVWFALFLLFTVFVVYKGVNHGIEKYSKILMPVLLLFIIGISAFSLTLSHTNAEGITRTGLQGFAVYVVPDLKGMTVRDFFIVLMDAMGQLFYSISVAMGIMIAYGSYVKKDVNLGRAVNQIEFFDSLVAFLAGLMIIPAVYTFMGTEGMSAGPGLMFVSLPKVFDAMGAFGNIIGILFFAMVAFAAVTSSVSIMEAIVSSIMDRFGTGRKKATLLVAAIAFTAGLVVCLGYNVFYFTLTLPNGASAQILDIMDYISNNCLMPVIEIATCLLIGWVLKPQTVIDEVTLGGYKFGRRKLYIAMIKIIAPALLLILLMQSVGLLKLFPSALETKTQEESPDSVSISSTPPSVEASSAEEIIYDRELAAYVTMEDNCTIAGYADFQGEDYRCGVFHLRSPEYETTLGSGVKMLTCDNNYWEIVVLRDETFVDVLRIENDEHGSAVPACEDLITEIDADFDEANDLLLCLGHFGTQGAVAYKCWLTRNNALTYCPSFTDISNPALDPERLTEQPASMTSEEIIWSWTDEIFVDGAWQVREYFTQDDYDEKTLYSEKVYGDTAYWDIGSDRWSSLYSDGRIPDSGI